jgi:NodT family efflux transporter outer membrane factor (OMF) lipoprotein
MTTLRPLLWWRSLAELALRRRRGRFAATLLASVSLTGCAVGPDFSAPAPPAEQNYLQEPATTLGSPGRDRIGQNVRLGATLQADWWTRLGSPELDRTVALALSNNRTIDIARANVAKAGELVTAARGGLYPQVDAAAGLAGRQYGASFLGPLASTFPPYSAYTGGLTVSYDLDLFGGTHRRIELAAADADVQGEALNATRLTVAGNTVVAALRYASIRGQIDVVKRVLASDQQNIALVEAGRGAGLATQMDVTTAQSQLDRDRALLPLLQQELDVTRNALAVLVGKSPATSTAPDFELGKMTLPQDIPLTLPSDLVRARPDIRAAEARLHVANAAVGVATADLYPRVTLSAAIAVEGLMAGPAGAAWSLIGGLAAPIFHGGELSARKRAAQDAHQAAFSDYQQTVLVAFQQIADNLHGLVNTADSVRTEQQALDSANAALHLTRLGYGIGNAGIIQVIDAQRLQQLAELNLVKAREQRYVVTVNLFVAAGGGLSDTSKQVAMAR